MILYGITCGACGKLAEFDEWMRTPVFGELPRNVFQCPNCKYAFRRRLGKAALDAEGMQLCGPVQLDPVGSVL